MTSNDSVKAENLEADLVIIGAGGAGMAAAAAAAEGGVGKIIVLEKRNATGGNTAMSIGPFAVDSPAQKRLAIEYRKDELFRVLMDFAHWKTNPRIVRAYLDKSGDTIRWLEEKGLSFECWPLYPNQAPLTWHKAEGGNTEVIKVLVQESRGRGVKILTNAPAKKLLTGEKGGITGVVTERDGKEFTIITNQVIIASGGYGGNKELLKKYCPQYRENMLCDGLRHTGDGFLMAMDVGANTEGLGLLLMSGPQVPGKIVLEIDFEPHAEHVALMSIVLEPDTLWVNNRGERFTDEGTGYHHFVCSNSVNRQPDNLCYVLMDSRLVKQKEKEGLLIGLGHKVFEERISMPGLERELQKQTEGLVYVEQVDADTCNGCGICMTVCPVGAVSLDTSPEGRKEISPCRYACPAGVDMRRYTYLLKEGKIAEAGEVLREFLPLPAVTGRVCPHFCETECARNDVDEAVNINSLERFTADFGLDVKAQPVPRKYKEKVAIIGSGPAGLSCAYFLTRQGYAVTIFEAMSEAGGMLRLGIPEYRLPRQVLDKQIDYILDMGAELKTGVNFGKDITLEQLQKDYQAVFFAIGNQLSQRIDLPGGELEGVEWGLDFLRRVNLKKKVKVADKVVVIGGGNVAMDVALTARRLGAKEVQVACLETGDEIPAYDEEIQQAINEGIVINEGWGPQKILGNDRVTGVELARCTRLVDGRGKFNPAYDKKDTKTLTAGMVILAIGQAPDHSMTPGDMELTGRGTVKVDAVTLETSLPGVFAGGEIVAGAASVVHAIADSDRAAVSIGRYLRGENLRKGRMSRPEKMQNPPREGIPTAARVPTPLASVESLKGNFNEIKTGYDREMAEDEVQRCMTCGSRSVITVQDECRLCHSCEYSCPAQAIYPAPTGRTYPHVKIADNWEEIAEWLGADPAVLKATVDEYNTYCAQGHDPLFAKDRVYLTPLLTPPYYAIRSNSDFLDTIGGIKINERMEVLDKQDKPIPGLYATGVAAGGWEDNTYCDTLSGTTSGFALNSGRIAGENVAAKLKEKNRSEVGK